MALDLPGLSSKFQVMSYFTSLVMPGTKIIVPANPERLAIGFSHAGGTDIAVFPLIDEAIRVRFFLLGNSTQWFYWQKHAAIVGLEWLFETSNLAGDSVSTVEIYSAEPRK